MGKRVLWGFLLLALCLFALPARGENRILALGCDHFLSQQDTAPASAQNTEAVLAALCGGEMHPAVALRCQDEVSSAADVALWLEQAFGEAESGDVSYLYLSSHGLWNPGQSASDMALLLSDGTQEGRITAGELHTLLSRYPGTKVLLVDACHAGAMIGKGVRENLYNLFSGPDYQVITSCGGAEESWFWAAQGDRVRIGAGSFSAALVRGLSAEGNYAADDNRDGEITLTELKRYLRSQHGESTVQTYPEESDFVLLRYDVAHMEKRRAAVVENLAFEDDVLNIYQPNVRFTYNVLRSARLLYRLVDQVEGRWDFAGASLTEDSSLPGSTPGPVSPGMKQRTLSLTEPQVGYALLQLVSVVNGETSLTASKLLCMPPERENPRLAVHVPERLRAGREMNIVIDHACPCELAVQIVDVEGKKVRRLCAREASRPQGLYPAGSSLCWNGRDSEGEQITGGPYRVQVLAWVGEDMYRASSGWFWID